MSTTFDPPAKSDCPICHGSGYTFSPRGEYASASICECVPYCKRCNGMGMRTITTEHGTRSGRCLCQKLPDRIRLFNRAQIPAIHGKSSLVNFKTVPGSKARTHSMIWAANFASKKEERGFILSGPVGVGKTHLLVGIIKNLIFEHGLAVRFVEFSRLLSFLRAGYSKGLSDSQLLNELSTIPILAIDEIGKGRVSDWELTIIDEVISRRYNSMKPLIGTTNYKWAPATGTSVPNLSLQNYNELPLGDRVGSRVFSRLQQMCAFTSVNGDDYRTMGLQRAR